MFPRFAHKNHPNTTKKRGVSDEVDDRETPADVFDPLNAEFGFTLDVAAARHNAKCKRYYALGPSSPIERRQGQLFPTSLMGDPEALGYDGLAQPWGDDEIVWCNPPFSDLEPWIAKAHSVRCTVVMLLPANRTEQPAWQTYIEPFRDGRAPGGPEVRFLPGRRSFLYLGEIIGNSTSKAPPFGIVIVIWRRQPWWCLLAAEQRWVCVHAATRAEAGERCIAHTGKIAAYVLTNEELAERQHLPNYDPSAPSKSKRIRKRDASHVQLSEESAGAE